jgi:hypothetical protein
MNEMNLSDNFEQREVKRGKKIIEFNLYYVTKDDFMKYYCRQK